MTQEQLIKKYFDLNKKLYKKAKSPLKCHDPNHHLRVCRLALALAEKEKIKIQKDILIPACLLHDMSAFYPDEIGLDHYHDEDPKLARKALEGIGEDKTKIDLICQVIALHGHEFKSENESVEATILRDADKIEAFGPLGVSRMIMSQTRRGLDAGQIIEKFYSSGMLAEKWNSLTTKEAKNLCRANYKFSLNFFKKLKEVLEKNK